LGSPQKNEKNTKKYKNNISKEIQKIIGARKGLLECRKNAKIG
jgi:hypothetical protein